MDIDYVPDFCELTMCIFEVRFRARRRGNTRRDCCDVPSRRTPATVMDKSETYELDLFRLRVDASAV